MKKAEIVERINSIDLDMLNIAVHAICASNPINPISANHGVITSRCGSVTRLGFTTRATKANMEAVYHSILDRIICCWDLETAHEIDPDYTPTWAIQIDPEDATPTREEVEAVLQESEEAETRAQALIRELRGTTEAAKALIEDAASITGKSAADFAGALSEYAAIVRGVAEEYQGKATVAMIRADHPELDFFDDEDIETIIRCGNSYTTTEAAEAGEENNMDYDYLEAVTEDVREYIRENVDLSEWKGNRDRLEEKLHDALWAEDCVTGNASGSYTFSAYRAEEYLCHNWDLLAEALRDFGADDVNPIDKGAEWCDLMIRCYLLGQAICEVLDELEDELEEDDSEEEEV